MAGWDRRRFRKHLTCLLLAVFIGGAIAALDLLPHSPWEPLELKSLDLRFQLRSPLEQHPDIVFVDMDQLAIDELGRWPWPRHIFADLILELQRLGARAVLFDILFTHPQQLIVERESLEEGLGLAAGRADIEAFVDQVVEAIHNQQVGLPETVSALRQIQEGMAEVEVFALERLEQALIDSDRTFAESIGQVSGVYLGQVMEIVFADLDRQRQQAHRSIRKVLRERLNTRPNAHWTELVADLPGIELFDDNEQAAFVLQMRLTLLLEDRIEITAEEAAARLGLEKVGPLLRDYQQARQREAARRVGERIFAEPDLSFQELIWAEEIFDRDTLQLFQEVYEEQRNVEWAYQRFGWGMSSGTAGLYEAIIMTPPLLELMRQAAGIGFLNAIPDHDGVVRRVPLVVQFREQLFPQIALAVLMDWLGVESRQVEVRPGEALVLHEVRWPDPEAPRDITIPIDAKGQMWVNWAESWRRSFTHVSAAHVYRLWDYRRALDVNQHLSDAELAQIGGRQRLETDQRRYAALEAELKPKLAGKTCIIGLTAPGTHDYNPVPVEESYPMVGTHGNIMNTVLLEQFLTPPSRDTTASVMIVLVVLMGVLLPFCSPVRGALAAILIAVAYAGACTAMFDYGLWWPFVAPLVGVGACYMAVTTYVFVTEEAEKLRIRSAFGHYLSKNVMEEVLSNPDHLALGGERRELSVMFSDIRAFTTFSEKRQPEEIVAILNEYLDAMTKVIFDHGGTLDKYVGDEIMAVFGAPGPVRDDHALSAVRCALAKMRRLHELQQAWVARGLEPLDIGIGVNTGDMVVGNMGSTELMDYTVIGDAVNLGARVEALTRDYNCHVIITEFTYAQVADHVEVKELDSVKVKGKDEPVVIYELLSVDGATATTA